MYPFGQTTSALTRRSPLAPCHAPEEEGNRQAAIERITAVVRLETLENSAYRRGLSTWPGTLL